MTGNQEAADWAERANRLAAESLAADDPTGWFERLYAAGAAGEVPMPWDRGQPRQLLVEWAQARRLRGAGRRALVVGCGLGRDAEYVAALGFDTVAFDISATAIQVVRDRFPDSTVRYLTADLLDPPAAWHQAFDLVVESQTVQALPDPPRREAIANVAGLVGPGGTLLVIAAAHDPAGDGPDRPDGPDQGPPWPLTRAEIDAFATGGVAAVRVESGPDPEQPTVRRWCAEFRRAEPG